MRLHSSQSPPSRTMKPKFFPSPAAWHAWLEEHHETQQELWVGFHKKDSGKPSITWPESVDGALCFGWIDGVRKSIDERSYVIRFTPRRPRSVWSAINIKRVGELTTMGVMRPCGCPGLRTTHREPVRDLCLRATERRQAERRLRKRVSRTQEGLEILPGAAAVVSEDRKLVGDQREEGRNATEAARPAYRGLRARTNHTRTAPAGRDQVTRFGGADCDFRFQIEGSRLKI